MMEFEYTPRHSPGNAAHLLSPVHAHGSPLNGFSSIQQIRRSLSRSPSKPGRYSIQVTRSANNSPTSPISPLSRSQAASAEPTTEPVPKSKYSVKRNGALRSSFRRSSPNSPLRRALSDNVSHANVKPPAIRKSFGEEDQENMDCSADHSGSLPELQFNEPVHFGFLKPDKLLQSFRKEGTSPIKSSPLKRSDGVMNLDAVTSGSPRNKRRSLHGPSLGSDFNIFDQGFDGTMNDDAESSDDRESEGESRQGWTTFNSHASSTQRRPFSLRKSTLQQRAGPTRPKHSFEAGKETILGPVLTQPGSRMSLDSALPLRSFDVESPFKRSIVNDPPVLFAAPAPRMYQSAPKPHPLSHALTLSSSSSNVQDDQTSQSQASIGVSHQGSLPSPRLPPNLSKSLPAGALRPSPDTSAASSQGSSQGSYATPEGYKMAKPLPQAFMSTELISKRNRNMDMPSTSLFSSVHMPDTPSKKAHVLLATSPATQSVLGMVAQPTHEFGSPSTSFTSRSSKMSPESLGKGANIFGTRVGAPQLTRRGSFLNIDGEDTTQSPTQQLESQSSNDDLPPTPTKSTSATTRPHSKGKNNSLRSSLFGRRASINFDTFAPPPNEDANVSAEDHNDCKYALFAQTPDAKLEKTMVLPLVTSGVPMRASPRRASAPLARGVAHSLGHQQAATSPERLNGETLATVSFSDDYRKSHAETVAFLASSPIEGQMTAPKHSPHTPYEQSDPLRTSTFARPVAGRAAATLASSTTFPPATPTGPRDQLFNGSLALAHASSSYFSNDVDTTLSARFGQVTALGMGEFSQVYRVENSMDRALATSQQTLTPGGRVWAVKKSRKPYAGTRDRQRQLREVHILKALRGHEHVIEFVDYWESKHLLYIQTEFCENGNMMDFLVQTGFKGRLDDFRIWKILLELSQGVKSIHDAGFIHLDLKPANVFIDWEGVLKIGDFGLASTWPAPAGLDGEGDREYIGPEVLSGRFDKPADIFSLGMIMLEIAGNIILPDNGTSWRRLRAGDMSDLPSLTWSSDSSLVRDESGDPVEMMGGTSAESLCISNPGDDDLSFLKPSVPKIERPGNLVKPPNFMVDSDDPQALDRVVQWMICPDPGQRPVIDQLLGAGGVQWVEHRRRAGATVYEGNWGPADDVLDHGQDVEMVDI